MFDSDIDGVLTLDQVGQAIGVLGIRRSGWSLAFTTFHSFYSTEEEILAQVKEVSEDSKNFSLEFNEFLKLVAPDIKSDATKHQDELFAAFEYNLIL